MLRMARVPTVKSEKFTEEAELISPEIPTAGCYYVNTEEEIGDGMGEDAMNDAL